MKFPRPLGRAAPILIACLFGTNLSYVAAALPDHTPGLSQLGGWVYVDRNNDGDLAFSNEPNPEFVIGGVTIQLYSQSGPETLLASTVSDDFGRWFFNDIAPGTYGLKQIQPIEWVDGLDTLGSMFQLSNQPVPPNASVGTVGNNEFDNIVLPANVRGDFYLFGERGMAPGFVSKRYLLGSAPDMNFAVPEPATVFMAISAAVGCMCMRRRRRHLE
jgi:SdrD B-like domain